MKGHRSAPEHSVPALFIFLLLGIFAVFSLVLVVFGAQAYRNTVEHTQTHNAERVVSSYIRNNLKTNDFEGGIVFASDEDIPRLLLTDPEDSEYVKYIYVYESKLCELYMEAYKPFNPEAGEEICDAEAISAQIENGLATVTVKTDSAEYTTMFALRCEEGHA